MKTSFIARNILFVSCFVTCLKGIEKEEWDVREEDGRWSLWDGWNGKGGTFDGVGLLRCLNPPLYSFPLQIHPPLLKKNEKLRKPGRSKVRIDSPLIVPFDPPNISFIPTNQLRLKPLAKLNEPFEATTERDIDSSQEHHFPSFKTKFVIQFNQSEKKTSPSSRLSGGNINHNSCEMEEVSGKPLASNITVQTKQDDAFSDVQNFVKWIIDEEKKEGGKVDAEKLLRKVCDCGCCRKRQDRRKPCCCCCSEQKAMLQKLLDTAAKKIKPRNEVQLPLTVVWEEGSSEEEPEIVLSFRNMEEGAMRAICGRILQGIAKTNSNVSDNQSRAVVLPPIDYETTTTALIGSSQLYHSERKKPLPDAFDVRVVDINRIPPSLAHNLFPPPLNLRPFHCFHSKLEIGYPISKLTNYHSNYSDDDNSYLDFKRLFTTKKRQNKTLRR